jgi:hypothetical protein
LRVLEATGSITGKKPYQTRGFKGNRRAAQRALAALVTEVAAGRVAPSNVTMQQLFDEWLQHAEHLGRSPSTIHGYRSLVAQLPPGFVATPLRKVTPKLIDDLNRHLWKRPSGSLQPCCASTQCCARARAGATVGLGRLQSRATRDASERASR